MTTAVHKPLRMFCSYSRIDEEHLNDLRVWLRGLERQGLIEWWHDREIIPGREYEKDIDENLRNADIILLLVSPTLMASDYVHAKEVSVAVDRHERGEACLIPIIVRWARWQGAPFAKLQALPKDAKPVATWLDRDEAWYSVAEGVEKAVEELLTERRERATKEQYRKAVEKAWIDNKINDAEAQTLAALASELDLSRDAAASIERDIMDATKETLLERQEQVARKKERMERLEGLYNQARELHQNQEWQAVVNVFEQIHSEEPAYPDSEKLLDSARKALEAQELDRKAAATYDLGWQHLASDEWWQAARCFEEVQILKPGYIETERLLAWSRRELAKRKLTPINADRVEFLGVLKGHSRPVHCVAFSPDGELLASGGGDNNVRLWRVEDWTLVRTLEGHTDSVYSMVFSPEGELLALAGDDKKVWLWRVEDWTLVRTLEGHTHAVESIAFSPDERFIVSGSDDNKMRLWQVRDGVPVHTPKRHPEPVTSVAFSPDGRLLASGATDNKVRLYRVEDWQHQRTLTGHTDWVRSVAFSPEGGLLASGGDDNMVRLWRVEDGSCLRTLTGHTDWVRSVAFSPDGRLLASGAGDKNVRLWGIA